MPYFLTTNNQTELSLFFSFFRRSLSYMTSIISRWSGRISRRGRWVNRWGRRISRRGWWIRRWGWWVNRRSRWVSWRIRWTSIIGTSRGIGTRSNFILNTRWSEIDTRWESRTFRIKWIIINISRWIISSNTTIIIN